MGKNKVEKSIEKCHERYDKDFAWDDVSGAPLNAALTEKHGGLRWSISSGWRCMVNFQRLCAS